MDSQPPVGHLHHRLRAINQDRFGLLPNAGKLDFGTAGARRGPYDPDPARVGIRVVLMIEGERLASQGRDTRVGSFHGERPRQCPDVSPHGCLLGGGGIHDADFADAGGKGAREKLNAPGGTAFPGENAQEIEVPLGLPVFPLARIGKAGSTILPAIEDPADVAKYGFNRAVASGQRGIESFVDMEGDDVQRGADRIGLATLAELG